MAKRPTVLIAEDHLIVADGLSSVLSRFCDVVGIVSLFRDIEGQVSAKAPAILILDLAFGKTSTLTLIPILVSRHPGTRIVVLTAHAEPVLADAALRAGAMAYVVKQSAPSELRVAIEEVLAGRTYLTPAMKALGAGGVRAFDANGHAVLSGRRRDILGLLRMGHTSAEVGARLDISGRTVDYHVGRMCDQLGIRGRAQLIRWAEKLSKGGSR